MTAWTAAWFAAQGFTIWHVPGMSRTWRRELPDGSYLLVTDPSGFDLPAAGEACAAMHLGGHDEALNYTADIVDEIALLAWIHTRQDDSHSNNL